MINHEKKSEWVHIKDNIYYCEECNIVTKARILPPICPACGLVMKNGGLDNIKEETNEEHQVDKQVQ